MSDKRIFKVEAEGDVLYFAAENLEDAKRQFAAMLGPVPAVLLTWTEIEELPDDEDFVK